MLSPIELVFLFSFSVCYFFVFGFSNFLTHISVFIVLNLGVNSSNRIQEIHVSIRLSGITQLTVNELVNFDFLLSILNTNRKWHAFC